MAPEIVEGGLRPTSARKAGEEFDAFIKDALDGIKIRVFLCGAALNDRMPIESQIDSNLRAYLWSRLEVEVPNCEVFFGEHKELIARYDRARGRTAKTLREMEEIDLAGFELLLSNWVELVVLFPDSPGSFAELGMFSMLKNTPSKLLVINEPKHKSSASYISRGPIRALKNRNGSVEHMAYEDKNAIFVRICQEIADLKLSNLERRYLPERIGE